ncbi:hypothetical protein CEXT_559251 [Caerostris extrusa]|uniref:Uncharacterized protein n=1 Tax=Caerostris extrusa TaxID=172846 RepID=A0AAV4UV43_CAEEX|nr:hypothetical protein CEXT_559251 [Caerostris extrusa]
MQLLQTCLKMLIKKVENTQPQELKTQPIMLTLTNNYSLALQEIHRRFADITKRLAKDYFKIYPQSEDNYHCITTYLLDDKLEYYIIKPKNERRFKALKLKHK